MKQGLEFVVVLCLAILVLGIVKLLSQNGCWPGGGSDGFVSFTAAPIATGWSEQFPGGTFTRSEPAPFHGARVMT